MVALDPDPLEPAPGLVAYNPRTTGGRELYDHDAGDWWRWAYAGVTFHPRHAETCTDAYVHAGQGALL